LATNNQFAQTVRVARKSNGIVTKRRIASASMRRRGGLPLRGGISTPKFLIRLAYPQKK
jgi:hypothetical protein